MPAARAANFEFVVIGDTRPKFESENFEGFETLLPRITRAQPAFVINLGDLIYGYGPRSKEKQWDKYQQVVRNVPVPYYQVPGNHDTHSREARRIYTRRFGRCYQSFDYADCHFVLLDNTEAQRWGYLGPAELDWLKRDLAQTQARSVFVFMHFPVWEPTRLTPEYHEVWQQTLHPLFKQFRVRAVFGGHFHTYGPTREFDGIQYFITGGGGAELIPEYKKAGGQHHFLRVRVSGERLDVRVVTERGELTDPEADIMGGFRFADKYSSRAGVSLPAEGLRRGATVSIAVEDPYREHLIGKADWVLDPSSFSVEPRSLPVQIPPGGSQTFTFSIRALKDAATLASAPRLQFDVIAGARRHRFYRDVLWLESMKAPFLRPPPLLDGQLEDWSAIPSLALGQASGQTARVQACHDSQNLYLALTMPSASQEAKEESIFPDDLQLGFARRLTETSFSGDFLRLGLSCGVSAARNRTPGSSSSAMVPGIRSVCRQEGTTSYYEVIVPLRFLKHRAAGIPNQWVLNLAFLAPEKETDSQLPSEPSLNSFAYEVRYGADALVPLHFLELQLEPKR